MTNIILIITILISIIIYIIHSNKKELYRVYLSNDKNILITVIIKLNKKDVDTSLLINKQKEQFNLFNEVLYNKIYKLCINKYDAKCINRYFEEYRIINIEFFNK